MKNKIVGKIIKIFLIIVGVVVLLFSGFVGGVSAYNAIAFSSFYSNATKEFDIPGLNTSYIPQGIAYSSKKEVFLNAGYTSDNNYATIYVTSKKDNSVKRVGIYNGETVFKCHCGGIAIYNDYVYISNSSRIYVLSLNDILNAKNGENASIKDCFYVPCNSSFCFANESMLYVGEYVDLDNGYSVDESHYEGENHGIVVGYKLSEGYANGVDISPSVGYCIGDYVQGFALSSTNRPILSISHGLSSSNLKIYKSNLTKIEKTISNTKKDVTLTYTLPFYLLNEDSVDENIVSHPMNEDLEYVNGRVYINNESASKKYIYGNLTNGRYVYSYKVL